jgi:hypothetical protein
MAIGQEHLAALPILFTTEAHCGLGNGPDLSGQRGRSPAVSLQLCVADWGRGSDWVDGGVAVTAPLGAPN